METDYNERTIGWYVSKIRDKNLRRFALNNCLREGNDNINVGVMSIEEVLLVAFNWAASPEGVKFWMKNFTKICDDYKHKYSIDEVIDYIGTGYE
jgi:hypothetical protein